MVANSNSIDNPSDCDFVLVNFHDLDGNSQDGNFQELSIEADSSSFQVVRYSELDEMYISLNREEIAGFTKEKLLEMCTFSKMAYGSDDEKLSQSGYKTRAELTNEGYKIIPFYYSDLRFYYSNSIRQAGFVFIKDREITIAYRGTKINYYDIIYTDLNALLTIPSFLHGNEMIHRGFYNALINSFESLYFILKMYAQEQKLEIKDFRINLTGHSMGGAIAKITALYLNKGEGAQDLHVATFGEPRVFNLDASKTYDSILGKNTIRVTQHRKDLVSAVAPGWWGYAHVGQQFRIKASYSLNLHKIDSYYTSISSSKLEDFKSNNSTSYFYPFVRVLTVVNSVALGTLYRIFAGLMPNNELELTLLKKPLILLPKLNTGENVFTTLSRSNTINVVEQELKLNNYHVKGKMSRSKIPALTNDKFNSINKQANDQLSCNNSTSSISSYLTADDKSNSNSSEQLYTENNNKKENDYSKRNSNNYEINVLQDLTRGRIAIATLVLAAVSVVAISVYLEMLMSRVAVGACCLVVAAIVYYTNRPDRPEPASLLESSLVSSVSNNESYFRVG